MSIGSIAEAIFGTYHYLFFHYQPLHLKQRQLMERKRRYLCKDEHIVYHKALAYISKINHANNFCFVLTLVTTSNHPNQTIGVSELSATMKTNTKTSANHDDEQYKTQSKMSMV
mgnify:CR=1 FL=1